jgi:hypothetical protein
LMDGCLRRVWALVLLLPMGCGDYAIGLPNGYELVRFNGAEIGICRPDGHVIVEPHVVSFAVLDERYVVGKAEVPKPIGGFQADRKSAGYFIVDTKGGGVWDSLTADEWRRQLGNTGIPEPSELVEPSRFDPRVIRK